MVYIILALGAAGLIGLLTLARAFVSADPVSVARFVRRFLISLAAIIVVAPLFMVLAGGRPIFLSIPGGAILVLLYRAWIYRPSPYATGAAAPRTSTVETDTVRMCLDRDSGAITGMVKRGRFAGRNLHDIGQTDLFDLWRHCRTEDEPAAQLLEAYLDRLDPDWRTAEADGQKSGSKSERAGARTASDAMSREEALAILGLSEGADQAAVKDAHHRLMMKLHPDHGGTTYLAAKLNRAREILLKG